MSEPKDKCPVCGGPCVIEGNVTKYAVSAYEALSKELDNTRTALDGINALFKETLADECKVDKDFHNAIMDIMAERDQLRKERDELSGRLKRYDELNYTPLFETIEMQKDIINDLRADLAVLVELVEWIQKGMEHITNEKDRGQVEFMYNHIEQTLSKLNSRSEGK